MGNPYNNASESTRRRVCPPNIRLNPANPQDPKPRSSALQAILRSAPLRLALDVHRWLWWLVGGLAVLLLGLHLLLRVWVVPQIPERRGEIESALSAAIQRPVRLGHISAGWSGLQPRVDIGSLTILDRNGEPALVLPAISAAVSWRSVAARTVVFSRLRTGGLELYLRRTGDGTVLLGDIPLNRGDDNQFLDWLQQQSGIDLERSVVHWDDAQRAAPRLTLRNVHLSIRNHGTRHQFGLRADPPGDLAGRLDLRGDWNGSSIARPESGKGRLYADVSRIDLATLAPWLDLPLGIRAGRGALRLWLDVAGAKVTGFTADAGLSGLLANIEGAAEPLEVSSIGGRIGLVNRPDRHSLELRQLSVQTSDGVVAPESTLTWQRQGEGADARHVLRIEHLVLGPLLQTAPALPLPERLRELLVRSAPRGELREVRAEWRGSWDAPSSYAIKGRFDEVGSAPVEGLPGFDRLSGTLDTNHTGGRLTLRGGPAPLLWPERFRRAIPLRGLDAVLSWRRQGEGWRFDLADARIDTGELQASLRGNWAPAAHALEIDAQVTRLDATKIVHYLPETVGKGTRDWLELAFPGGGTASGAVRLRGDPARFPFENGEGGRFEATADLQVPSLMFSPQWPRLSNVEGRLRFVNAALSAEGARGRVGNSDLEQIKLSIPDLDAADPFLDIGGRIGASIAEVLDYIQTSPVRRLVNGATDGMSGTGRANLGIALRVPLNHSVDTTVRGEVGLDASRLELGAGRPAITGLSGRLLFTERGISSPGLSGNLLGGAARGVISSQPGGVVHIEASGRARIASLAQQFPLEAWGLASGDTGWRGDISIGPTSTRLLVQSELEGVTLSLPAPLYKAAGQPAPLRFAWQSGERGDLYELDIGERVRARVQSRSGGAAAPRVETALVAVGGAALPAARARGIGFAAELPQFFATQWLPVIERFTAGGDGGAPLPVEARIKAGRFELEGQFLGETELVVDRRDRIWNWAVRGADAEGSGQWDPADQGSVTARLSRLALGPPVDSASSPVDVDDGAYPALDVEIGSFSRRGRDYGQLRLKASQQGRDWRIDQLRLSGPEYQLEASGLWQAWRSSPVTDVRLELKTTDTGRYLERLGYGSVLRAAPASLSGTLRWRGPPTDIHFPSLSGQFRLEAGKGQFVKADPGAARLLGILSLQALPRRITLDFRDVFSEGLAFDSIESDLAVTDGIMRSEQLFIDGPSAKVRIKGQADLGKETQDLQVKVSPAMDAATIGALIANPVAGLAVFLAQQLLDDPLSKLITFNYRVTGSWAEPVVTKQGAPEVSNRTKGDARNGSGVMPGIAP